MDDMYREEYREPSGDDNEVKFNLKEKGAEKLVPCDLEGEEQDAWLRETMPHHGARKKTLHEGRPLIGVDQEDGMINTTVEATNHRPNVQETAGRNRHSDEWPPWMALENTVSRMQRELEDLQADNRFLKKPRPQTVPPLIQQAALTTTKVPWFNGSTSWDQYQQVFDAIVLSNGWGDATSALQLLSHLQGDALNVALLIPMPRRSSRKELTTALSAHYGSPGRLANYRREFDRTVRRAREDPSNFAIALETLAVKAFGDMDEEARLRLIRDRFIAGHESCALRRYLDGAPPDSPLHDVVDRCRV